MNILQCPTFFLATTVSERTDRLLALLNDDLANGRAPWLVCTSLMYSMVLAQHSQYVLSKYKEKGHGKKCI